jgi:hypothetical protein
MERLTHRSNVFIFNFSISKRQALKPIRQFANADADCEAESDDDRDDARDDDAHDCSMQHAQRRHSPETRVAASCKWIV